jgi:endonuclease/exonuclease/phosphatase family metal-dependent hydrolase
LVILQEATRPAGVAKIASLAGMPHYGSRPGNSLAYLSRDAVAHAEWHKPRFSRHAFLEVVPEKTNVADVRVFGLHLSAVHSAWTERRRAIELGSLIASIARHQHGPHILIGDFNTLAPGEFLDARKLPRRLRALVWLCGGRIRFRTIQRILDAGYVDCFRRLTTDNPGYTFPTWSPHVRLDFAFVPERYAGLVTSCEVVRPANPEKASDHFPLLVRTAATIVDP